MNGAYINGRIIDHETLEARMLAGRGDRLMAPAIAAKPCVRTPWRPTASTASAPRRRSRGGDSQQFITRGKGLQLLL